MKPLESVICKLSDFHYSKSDLNKDLQISEAYDVSGMSERAGLYSTQTRASAKETSSTKCFSRISVDVEGRIVED